VVAYGGEDQHFFSVYIRLENPGKEATSFRPDWALDLTKAAEMRSRMHIRHIDFGPSRHRGRRENGQLPFGPAAAKAGDTVKNLQRIWKLAR
jgi:hypothetical protein